MQKFKIPARYVAMVKHYERQQKAKKDRRKRMWLLLWFGFWPVIRFGLLILVIYCFFKYVVNVN